MQLWNHNMQAVCRKVTVQSDFGFFVFLLVSLLLFFSFFFSFSFSFFFFLHHRSCFLFVLFCFVLFDDDRSDEGRSARPEENDENGKKERFKKKEAWEQHEDVKEITVGAVWKKKKRNKLFWKKK